MDAVLNNPFRVLGLKTTASDKEIAKRISDLTLYAEMGKKIKYKSDCEFLGGLDRSLTNIKQAAKRLENNDLKLFYSLMWYEINDEIDETALKLFEENKYDLAKNLLEEDIFSNCPIVYNVLSRLWGGIQIDAFNFGEINETLIKAKPNKTPIKYDIKTEYSPPQGLQLVSFTKRSRISTFFDDLIQIEETIIKIPVIDKYQIYFVFLPIQLLTKKIVLTLTASSIQNFEYDFVIDVENIFTIFEKKTQITSSNIIHSCKIEIDYLNKNSLSIENIDNEINVWFNCKKVYTINNNYPYSSFYLSILGPIFIYDFNLFELANRKLYANIILNHNTINRVKNLAFYCLLGENKNFRSDTAYDFFRLYSKLYKQNYFKQYSQNIVSDSYIIDVSKITDLFIEEFYNQFKNGIHFDKKHPELSFPLALGILSEEARKKAEEKMIGQRVYDFEELLSKTTEQRINNPIDSFRLAETLYKSAIDFLKWYKQFYPWENINYSIMEEKVGKELLECGIAHYNSSRKTIDKATEAIQIIYQSSEFARNLELRERVQLNLNVISDFHQLDKKEINFTNKDVANYIDSFSFKGTFTKPNPTTQNKETTTLKFKKSIDGSYFSNVDNEKKNVKNKKSI